MHRILALESCSGRKICVQGTILTNWSYQSGDRLVWYFVLENCSTIVSTVPSKQTAADCKGKGLFGLQP